MAFFKTAYETTVGLGINTKPIELALQKAILEENFVVENNQLAGVQLPTYEDGGTPGLVTTRTDSEQSIPMFAHPILVDLSKIRKSPSEVYMVSDARPFMTGQPVHPTTGALVAKNKTEYEFTRIRTMLSSDWYRGSDQIRYLSPVLCSIYSQWISEALARRFGLDMGDQNKLAMVAAYLYQSLFYEGSTFTEEEKTRMAPLIAKASYTEVQEVLEMLDAHPVMKGIQEFCDISKTLTANPRLDDLNPALMVTIMMNSWIGTNARAIASVALEHIPTFVTMVYGGFTEKSYKHAGISRTLDRFRGKKGEDNFLINFKRLIEQLQSEV